MTLAEFLRQFGSSISEGSLLALPVALVAGIVASAVCPCTVPMGLGIASIAGAEESAGQRRGLPIAAAFFAGIVVNLTLLGALAGRLGAVLTGSFGRSWTLAMALVSLLAAALAFYGPRLPVERLAALRRPGLVGAFAYGFIFSLGTSAAPLLVLLTIAAAQADALYGLVLAMTFGIGRGLPFLFLGVFVGELVRFTRLGQWRRGLQVASGVLLLIASFYYARAYAALA